MTKPSGHLLQLGKMINNLWLLQGIVLMIGGIFLIVNPATRDTYFYVLPGALLQVYVVVKVMRKQIRN